MIYLSDNQTIASQCAIPDAQSNLYWISYVHRGGKDQHVEVPSWKFHLGPGRNTANFFNFKFFGDKIFGRKKKDPNFNTSRITRDLHFPKLQWLAYIFTRTLLQRLSVSLAWRLDREMRRRLILHETGFTRYRFFSLACISSETHNRQRIFRPGGGGLVPYIGYIGMCRAKGMFFLAVLVWNSVSIWTIVVWNRVWFVHSSLELGMFLE